MNIHIYLDIIPICQIEQNLQQCENYVLKIKKNCIWSAPVGASEYAFILLMKRSLLNSGRYDKLTFISATISWIFSLVDKER